MADMTIFRIVWISALVLFGVSLLLGKSDRPFYISQYLSSVSLLLFIIFFWLDTARSIYAVNGMTGAIIAYIIIAIPSFFIVINSYNIIRDFSSGPITQELTLEGSALITFRPVSASYYAHNNNVDLEFGLNDPATSDLRQLLNEKGLENGKKMKFRVTYLPHSSIVISAKLIPNQ